MASICGPVCDTGRTNDNDISLAYKALKSLSLWKLLVLLLLLTAVCFRVLSFILCCMPVKAMLMMIMMNKIYLSNKKVVIPTLLLRTVFVEESTTSYQ